MDTKDPKNDESTEPSVVELTRQEEKDVEAHVPQRTPVIFEIIRRMGEEELNRPWISLWWSGVAAGLSMGLSLLSQALLRENLHGVPGGEIIEKFGYCVGFLVVILARQQLFTENTLSSVVPVVAHFHANNLRKIGRLWGTVLLANVVGTTLFGFFLSRSLFISPETFAAIHEISMKPFTHTALELASRGVVAGFIIASLVWILANVEGGKAGAIIVLTFIIALGNLAHIIAGSVEAAFVFFEGSISFGQAVFGFFLPTLIGNVVGGTLLFAMLAYGQTHREFTTEENR